MHTCSSGMMGGLHTAGRPSILKYPVMHRIRLFPVVRLILFAVLVTMPALTQVQDHREWIRNLAVY